MTGSITADTAERESVALLNQRLELRPEEAVELWTDGVPMPPQTHGRMDPDRIRRSADGQWVVRRDSHRGSFPSHDHTAAWALAQFERLQGLGLNVISRAIMSAPDGETILTATPWLADISECTGLGFDAEVTPVLNQYFAGAAAGSLILADLRKRHQYSRLRSTSEVLLHDVDVITCRAYSGTTHPAS